MDELIRRRLQYGAAVAACLGGFCLGCCLGWNSPCSELLKQKYNFPTLERNLIGAALPLGCLLGVIVVPFLVDRIGRKNTMLAIIPPFVFGWLLIIFAFSSVPLYVLGRFITGFFSGMYCVLSPMYCAEISEKEIRGSLGVFFQLFLVIGILFAFCTGYVKDVMWISILNGVTPIVFGIILFCMPESPLYYIIKGKDELAVKAMERLRGKDFDFGSEISEFKKIVDVNPEEKVGFKYIFKKSLRKILCLAYGLMIAQQLCGINAIIFYGVTIFEATGTEMDSLTQNVCVGVVQVIACTVAALIVDKMEDEGNHGNDDTRCFILSTLAALQWSRVSCVLCRTAMLVFDRYPLVDGTFFLSPRQHSHACAEVKVEGRTQFLSAVCMSCLEGSGNAPVRCRSCTQPWDGSSLVLGTMYSYDIFAAMPCCTDRLKCNSCQKPLIYPHQRLNFYSDYSRVFACPHCRTVDAHFVKPLSSCFTREQFQLYSQWP